MSGSLGVPLTRAEAEEIHYIHGVLSQPKHDNNRGIQTPYLIIR